jgi:hypothetical protein
MQYRTLASLFTLCLSAGSFACSSAGDDSTAGGACWDENMKAAYPCTRGGIRNRIIELEPGRRMHVVVQVIDGVEVVEGDIILSEPRSADERDPLLGPGQNTLSTGRTAVSTRWSNDTVPYLINAGVTNHARITDAIAHWEARTPLRFPVRTTQTDYLEFVPAPNCSSGIGRIGGRQTINLGDGCSTGATIHEIGHAIGLWHEQSRVDRDNALIVHWANIVPAEVHNFRTYVEQGGDGFDYGRHDFDSIMHYGSLAWSANGEPTLTKLDGSTFEPPGTGLSSGDIAGVRRMYASVAGDIAGLGGADFRSDIALTGGVGWSSIPVARSNGDGSFTVTNSTVANFPAFAVHDGAKPVPGDFNGDGRGDIALTAGVGWTTVPIAFSNGNGTFNVTNLGVANFPSLATQTGAKPVAGDFNADGRADIALTGGVEGWNSVPVAFSIGNGTFNVTNFTVANFPTHAAQNGAKPVAGDFNGDGRDDIALTGGAGWGTIPVAFSNGNGTFSVTNLAVASFPGFAAEAGAKPVSGDFNGDGRGDIALTGGNWSTIPVALSNGNGTFSVTNLAVANFPGFAAETGAKPVAGDFNGDGRGDIALTGGNWATVPVAFSNGNGTFNVTNTSVFNLPSFAIVAGAKPVGAG